MHEEIKQAIEESASTVASLNDHLAGLVAVSEMVVETLRGGGKVMAAGNGGSAAESLHLAEELVGRYKTDRPSLPGISLVADGTALTCIGNDFGFEHVFSRQIEGLGRSGDVLVLFSTSGQSENLPPALEAARLRGIKTVCILGRDGGVLAGVADVELIVKGEKTERIQEAHQVVIHLILDAVERAFPVTA